MGYSYDPSNPAALSDQDKVRLAIGDTGPDWQLSDEEIAVFLSLTGSVASASEAAARAVAARYAGAVSTAMGPLSVQLNQKAEGWRQLAQDIRATSEEAIAGPLNPAMSVGGKQMREANPDRVQPFFKRD